MSGGEGGDLGRVIRTLKGPVALVFRRLLPPLRDLSGEQLYALALGNSDLLRGFLEILRRRRSAFSHILVDSRGRHVADDFVPLACGYSLHEIVTLLVRTHAKRHFEAALGGERAKHLFEALKDYLVHDWQVPLVPHYAPLPLERVLEMGPALMEIRLPHKLDAISGASLVRIAAAKTLAEQAARRPATSAPMVEGEEEEEEETTPARPSAEIVPFPRAAPPRIQPTAPVASPEEEYWAETLKDRQVRNALSLREPEIADLARVLARTGPAARTEFMSPLKLSLMQAAIALVAAYRALGPQGFAALFGDPGDARRVAALRVRLESQGVGSRSEPRALMRAVETHLSTQGLAKGL